MLFCEGLISKKPGIAQRVLIQAAFGVVENIEFEQSQTQIELRRKRWMLVVERISRAGIESAKPFHQFWMQGFFVAVVTADIGQGR